MYTSNTSMPWTSPEKTNDTVVKSTGQVDLAVAVISLNKRTVVWMNGWPGASWIYLTFYDLMARFDFAGVCACAQTQIMTLVMMSRSAGLCGKHHPTSQLFALFYLTTRFHFPASTFWYFHLFDLLSRIFLCSLASSPCSPFPSCCTSTSTAHLCLPRLPSRSRPFAPCIQFSSQSPIQHRVFLYISPCDLPFMLGSSAVWRPPPLCFCCVCFISIPYLPQWSSLLCIRPR